MIFEFQEDGHRYFADRCPVPGVTEAMTKVGLMPPYERVPSETMDDARWRGTVVHAAIKMYESGKTPDLRHPEYQRLKIPGYFDGYRRFRDDHIDEVLECELLVGSEIFRYCGRLDLIPRLKDGRVVLLDAKTGEPGRWWEVQCSGYLNALSDEMKKMIEGYAPLRLFPDGTYGKLEIINDMRPLAVFLAALTVVNYRDYWK